MLHAITILRELLSYRGIEYKNIEAICLSTNMLDNLKGCKKLKNNLYHNELQKTDISFIMIKFRINVFL